MAEAIEINFPTDNEKNPKIDSELKNQILGFNVKEDMDGNDVESCPEEYKVEGDSLSAYWNYYEQEKQSIKGKNEQKISRPLNKHKLQWN